MALDTRDPVHTKHTDDQGKAASPNGAPERAHYDPAREPDFPPPNLGRSVHVVGTVVNVNPNDTPHPKVRRGEMGKALFNYLRNTVAVDPPGRTKSTPHRHPRHHFPPMRAE